MKPKLKKYKKGKLTDAPCPVCGRFMKMQVATVESGDINVYYCTNLKHSGTGRVVFEE